MHEETKEFLFLLILLMIFGIIYAVYTVPTQIASGQGIPYPDPRLADIHEESWAETGPRIFSAFILFSVLSVFIAIILTLVWRSWRLYGGERRHILVLFGKALGLYLISTVSAVISLIAFLVFQKSYVTNNIFGLVYPVLLPITYAFSAVAAYYTFKFSYWFAFREEPAFSRKLTILLPLFLLLIVMVSPYNWYGAYTLDKSIPNIRPITNVILFVILLLAIVQSLIFIKARLSVETDPINRARIKTIMLGFALVLAIYIFNVIYEIFMTKMLIIFILSYFITGLSIILVYLGLISPRFYMRYLERRLSK